MSGDESDRERQEREDRLQAIETERHRQAQRRESERQHTRNQEEAMMREQRGICEAKKNEISRRRRTPRARATRLEQDYDKFTKVNSDPSVFTTYEIAELDELKLRAETLRDELKMLDGEVSDLMRDRAFQEDEVDAEVEACDKYTSKIQRVLACCNIVESERLCDVQVKIN